VCSVLCVAECAAHCVSECVAVRCSVRQCHAQPDWLRFVVYCV